MGYSNYSDIAAAIADRNEFDGNSARGRRYGNGYVIYSYGTEIAKYVPSLVGGFEWVLNASYYSRTTSRLQNLIRRNATGHLVELDGYDYRAW